jgi:predicted anti-sigma-YlaC factor YlaD
MTSEREMTCREIVELTTEYLEGTLPSDLRQQFVDHLARCLGCENYLEQMRETIRMTGMISEDEIPREQRDHLVLAFRDWSQTR